LQGFAIKTGCDQYKVLCKHVWKKMAATIQSAQPICLPRMYLNMPNFEIGLC